jgi:hypothetical protein
MVAYQIESDLLELIRPHYKRVEEEGRTFIQTALQDAADFEPTQDRLRITLAPLSSPHRSRVLEALCEALNQTHTKFPGSELEMHYWVASAPESPKSGQISEVLCQEGLSSRRKRTLFGSCFGRLALLLLALLALLFLALLHLLGSLHVAALSGRRRGR